MNDLKLVRILRFDTILRKALNDLFTNHIKSIFKAKSKGSKVLHCDDKYYVSDSQSCGQKVANAASGKDYVIEIDNISSGM